LVEYDPEIGLRIEQKPLHNTLGLWNSTFHWRATYFDDLCNTDPSSLPECLQAEREFVIAENEMIHRSVSAHERVVEFGCGVGRSVLASIRRYPGKFFAGIDYAPNQILLFHKEIVRGRHHNAAAILADVGATPFRDGSFDCLLICNQTFGTFLGETRRSALREVQRLLAPGGTFLIGGFTNLALAEECYSAWNIPLEWIDSKRRLVSLGPYMSLWQDEAGVIELLASSGFALKERRSVKLGFVDAFLRV
jgi:SAM-dependent methyltransferase